MENRINFKIVLCILLMLVFLSSLPIYSQNEERMVEIVSVDLTKLQVNNENFLSLLDTFVINEDYRTEHRKDYIHIIRVDTSHCAIWISLVQRSAIESKNILGFFWRNDIPFLIGGDNPDNMFIQTGEKECFYYEKITMRIGNYEYDPSIRPEEFILWTFKICNGNIEFIMALLPTGRVRSDIDFSLDQPCCP